MPEGRGLFEVARERMRTRHLALRTEAAYLQWLRRDVKFHRRHPRDMGPADVEAFLSHLAVASNVSASTQNQALQALLFLYRQVLGVELPWLANVTRATKPKRLPVVLSVTEVRSVLAQLDGTSWLIANLLYGSGLRLMEAHRLRVKDLVLERGEVIVRDAKGGRDRVTVLPAAQIAGARGDVADGSRAQVSPRGDPMGVAMGVSRGFATKSTREPCSERLKRPCIRRRSCSRRAVTPFAIASPRICSSLAPTSARCRNSWAMLMCAQS